MKFRFNKRQEGFDHILLGVAFVVLFGIVGAFYYVYLQAAPINYPIVNASGKCLDNTGNIKRENNPVIIYTCNKTGAQQWTHKANKTIVNQNGLCLTALGTSNGDRLVVAACAPNNPNQYWNIDTVAHSIRGQVSNKCVDNRDKLVVDKNPIQIWSCTGNSQQVWVLQNKADPAVINSFTATPGTVNVGQSSRLSWVTTNAVSCTVSPGGPVNTTSTTWTTPPLDSTSKKVSYTLICKNEDDVHIANVVNIEVKAPLAPQPPTGKALLGIYHGGPTRDDDIRNVFGRYPDVASTYYQAQQAGKLSAEKARIDKGIRPVLTITGRQNMSYMQDIAAKSGAGWTWINTYVDQLKILSDYAASKNLLIYASYEHEWEVKVNQQILTGSAADSTTYAKALSNFFALTDAKAPNVVTMYWYGQFDKPAIDAVGSKLTVAPDMFTLDPYSGPNHPGTETFIQMTKPKLDWLKSRSWYKGQPIGITEFGARHSDSQMAQYFFPNLRSDIRQLDLSFAIFFNRNDTNVVNIDTNYPLSRAAFSRSLAAQ